MTDYFISDPHFMHKNIIHMPGFKGKFESVEEHDKYILNGIMQTVKKNDRLFMLGDIAFRKEALKMFRNIPGTKYLISGNHDTFETKSYLQEGGFHKVCGAMYYYNCILTHIPVHPSEFKFRRKYNIHGHLHTKVVRKGLFRKADSRYINVCVEHCTDWKPMSFEQLIAKHYLVIDGRKP